MQENSGAGASAAAAALNPLETQLAEGKARLREQHALYDALLDAQSDAGVGLFIIEQGRIIFANAAMSRLFGYSDAEFKALPSFIELAHPEDRERIMRNHQRRLAGEQFTNRYDIGIVTKAGERREAEITAGVMPAEHGPRILVIVVDITESQRAEAEVRRLNAELEGRVRERTAELVAANRELESFAYTISHDLRAPLRGIDGFSQLLLDEYGEQLDAQGQDYLGRVRRAAQRLGALIDDLLELSRVTRKEMRRETVDLSRLAREILDEMARSNPQRRVDVVVEPGCTVRGDPQLLRILLENLLDNAWKYTGKTPQARIEVGREAGTQPPVFLVRDNGAGFDMRYADRLFSPFQRLHKADQFEGTGIGLASAARVVHRHGGKIWVDSAIGHGTAFRFTLGASPAQRE